MIIRSRAPLRLGFGGGGTDVNPFSDLYGGLVLNATIDKYAYANIITRDDDKLRFVAADHNLSEEYAASDFRADGKLALHRAVYRRIMRDYNGERPLPLTLTTLSDVPAGSGLGSSSTLVVAMVKAFVEMLNLPLGEYEIAHLAYEIERIDVGLNGGKQDQYAATFGGFNFMEFGANDRVVVNPLRIKNWIISEFESSLVLYFTGVSRDSADIIDQQSANVGSGNAESIGAMKILKEEAVHMKECLLRGEIQEFSRYMGRSWEAKKRTAGKITNAGIDQTYQAALDAGAYAGKVSGAGGGGFMMFIVDPVRRMDVINALSGYPGYVMNCHFVKHGTEGWRIS